MKLRSGRDAVMFVFMPCVLFPLSYCYFLSVTSKHLPQHPVLEQKPCEYETRYVHHLIATFSARGVQWADFPLFFVRNGREIYFREVFYETY